MMNKKQSNICFKTKKQPIWHFWVDLTMVSSMFSDSCPRRWPGSSTGVMGNLAPPIYGTPVLNTVGKLEPPSKIR